ncbi:phytanoyl-CoA dioxygenase [Alkalilimnicola ehrlichii]|uniref:Phytanoyl-CoA dioxygenase n=1 Tax=Alkalilimnicola ehrlichii TaxID=351052 RepID=A0A3E0WG14_9GAMM|nr:phytanoyl-CoA dioxygenase family protein [Alkalilimnicola ehrlichii]RFA26605.1 phytanoyl-CoA dioxygenase [Alkalilimnicola ehrlichii]RFA31882.1 phytanoyl-CoA dioxygenase [Alkalilimnicola ehrlichii]
MLTDDQIRQFIDEGFVKLENAFSPELAKQCRDILWADTGCDPDDPSTWKESVVWLWDYDQEPFVTAANTPTLHAAFDQLVGKDRWEPRYSLGTFPIRFPAKDDTGDTGWHVDASFPGPDADPNDFSGWRINVYSRDRALLMLFLFSDVGPLDAPTRIRVGSHREVARILAPAGEAGLESFDLSATEGCEEVLATGRAGTVFLCHPFLVHAAQVNRGTRPRFLAQPPLYLYEPFQLDGKDEGAYVPVEEAIRRALGKPEV